MPLPQLDVMAMRHPLGRKPYHLSEREHQILDCLVKGHANKLIAKQLAIADTTVKVHVKALLRKLQVANRTQAAILALSLQSPECASAEVVDLAVSPKSLSIMRPS
jgi:DNA-binding NarL/FixJ family response regulator